MNKWNGINELFDGCLINLDREEKEMEEIVYRNVSSRSACSERKIWFQWAYGVWLRPKHNVLLSMLLNLFFPSNSTDHHEIPVLREVE